MATQDPVLRKRFTGTPEHVINFFFFIAEEVRELMSKLGFRTFNEMVGQVGKLDIRKAVEHWKAHGVDLSRILYPAGAQARRRHPPQRAAEPPPRQGAGSGADQGSRRRRWKTRLRCGSSTRSATSTAPSAPCCRARSRARYGHAGLPDDTISISLTGTAGQSFGAFLARGVSLYLSGDGNDYVGKGLSGGRVVVRQPAVAKRNPSDNIIVGNTVLYGAIAGEAYFQGVAGERFAVRNSGAVAVVEGCGDHGCEYMTGGVVVVLGETGRNFAAGMSGGIAYVYDEHDQFRKLCNMSGVELEPVGVAELGLADEPGRPRQRGSQRR